MLEGDMIYAIISPIAGILCLSLGIYVFLSNRYLRGSRVFILFMSMAAVMGISDFFLITAPDASTAKFFAVPTLFFGICTGACLPYLSYFMPCERDRSFLVRHRREYLIVVLISALIPVLMLSSVSHDQYGWWASEDLAMNIWMAIGCTYCLISMFILISLSIRARNEDVRRLSAILTVGVSFPLLYGVIQVITYENGITTPPLLSASVFCTSLIFLYALARHRLFLVRPVSEESCKFRSTVPAGERIPTGGSGLIECQVSEHAYRMFVQEVSSGSRGLVVSRKHPSEIRERYGLSKTPMVWLSTQPHPDRIDPNGLSILRHTILEFQSRGNRTVVLLDGLEYMISNNDLEKVLIILYELKDSTRVTGSKLIVPIDPEGFSSRTLALLEKDLEIIQIGNEPHDHGRTEVARAHEEHPSGATI